MVAELSIAGGALAGLVRRGVVAAQDNLAQLRIDAEAYENSGPEMEVSFEQVLPLALTGLLAILVIASVRYTIGVVMATLAMVESPITTEIIEPKAPPPPPYHEAADEASEKTPFMEQEDEEVCDVEITTIRHKPISAKITTTIRLLQRDGGFFSRWRGLHWSVIYIGLHSIVMQGLLMIFGFSQISMAFCYVLASLLLFRLHASWTHSLIAQTRTFKVNYIQNGASLFLPTLVFATAQQATFRVPLSLAQFLFSSGPGAALSFGYGHACAGVYIYHILGVVAVALTTAILAFAVLLPASITLTRIEAALMPEGMATIVPFDKASIIGGLDLQTRSGRKALFVQTWRSADLAARFRIVKVYLKMILVQFTVALVGLHLVVAEAFLIGYEKLALFSRSGYAQLRLAAAGAE